MNEMPEVVVRISLQEGKGVYQIGSENMEGVMDQLTALIMGWA